MTKKYVFLLASIFSLILLQCKSIDQDKKITTLSHFSQEIDYTKKSFQTTIIEPKKIEKIGKNHYFIDFGKAAFGTLVLKMKSPQNDTILVHLGEKIIAPNTIDRKPPGTIRYQQVTLSNLVPDQDNVVQIPPNKSNTSNRAVVLPDSFDVVMPFRYCELENFKRPIDELTIYQKMYYHKFDDNKSSFTSSDITLNQIWDLCKHTIKATSFAGVYIDGDRERIPYEADAYINQLSHYSVDSEYAMARRTNEYFIDNPTWPTEWILHTILLFYADLMYTGDTSSISKNYEALKYKTLSDLERNDGLISSKSASLTDELMKKIGFKNVKDRIRDIVDWPPGQNDTSWKLADKNGERDGYEMVDINTVVNSFYYKNLKLISKIAGILGKKEDSIFYEQKSIIVRNTINEKLFDKIRGVYLDGEGSSHASLHSNMFPLAFDLVPQEHVKSVVSFVKSRGMACSVYGAQYLLEGLFKQRESEYAFLLMTDSLTDRSWWNMINVGSTLTLEAWDLKYKPNLDWNHAWGTAPANIITRYMWGIKPSRPGFSEVTIDPQLGALAFSKIKTPTINGVIHAEYKLKGDKYQLYKIDLPNNMKGNFIVPKNEKVRIKINNKTVKKDINSIDLISGLNIIEIRQ